VLVLAGKLLIFEQVRLPLQGECRRFDPVSTHQISQSPDLSGLCFWRIQDS